MMNEDDMEIVSEHEGEFSNDLEYIVSSDEDEYESNITIHSNYNTRSKGFKESQQLNRALIQGDPNSSQPSSSNISTPKNTNSCGILEAVEEDEPVEYIDIEGSSLNNITVSEAFLLAAEGRKRRPDGRIQELIDLAEMIVANKREQPINLKTFLFRFFQSAYLIGYFCCKYFFVYHLIKAFYTIYNAECEIVTNYFIMDIH